MWSRIEKYIDTHNLLKAKGLYVVALSGGADSVALLLLLRDHGFNIHAAHCNFRLRGAESDRDEQFCVSLCQRCGVELHRAHFDTQTYAHLHGVSIEMAARELRYRWFGQLCRDLGADGVCVAHHRDDTVETVLLNLVRGTGLRGLTGIQPRSVWKADEHTSGVVAKAGQGGARRMSEAGLADGSGLVVLRPLLCVSRAEIEHYLSERGQQYVTDSTNLETDALRNKVRLQVLPLLQTLNPAVAENIRRTAQNLAGAQALLDAVLSDSVNSNELELNRFNDCASIEYAAYEWMKNYGFNGSQVRQILMAETGSIVTSSWGFDVLKDRERLLAEPSLEPMKTLIIPEEGTYSLPAGAVAVAENAVAGAENAKIRVRMCVPFVSTSPFVATLDARKVQFPLTLRRAAEGDWMQPYGMQGRKLLSDLMTDRKMTLFEKRRQLVLSDAGGSVVWAVGLRVCQQAAVTAETIRVLELQLVTHEP